MRLWQINLLEPHTDGPWRNSHPIQRVVRGTENPLLGDDAAHSERDDEIAVCGLSERLRQFLTGVF